MKIDIFSPATQEALRNWAKVFHNDELMLDGIGSSPEHWAWVWFQLLETEDRPEWFPRGKSATLQFLEGRLRTEARECLLTGLI